MSDLCRYITPDEFWDKIYLNKKSWVDVCDILKILKLKNLLQIYLCVRIGLMSYDLKNSKISA
jgi:hypothetical protein